MKHPGQRYIMRGPLRDDPANSAAKIREARPSKSAEYWSNPLPCGGETLSSPKNIIDVGRLSHPGHMQCHALGDRLTTAGSEELQREPLSPSGTRNTWTTTGLDREELCRNRCASSEASDQKPFIATSSPRTRQIDSRATAWPEVPASRSPLLSPIKVASERVSPIHRSRNWYVPQKSWSASIDATGIDMRRIPPPDVLM